MKINTKLYLIDNLQWVFVRRRQWALSRGNSHSRYNLEHYEGENKLLNMKMKTVYLNWGRKDPDIYMYVRKVMYKQNVQACETTIEYRRETFTVLYIIVTEHHGSKRYQHNPC